MAELVKIKNGEEYTSAMIKDNSSSDIVFFDVIRLADYNQLTGERMELGDKEAILFTNGENYGKDKIRIDEETWMVKKELDTAPFGKKSDSNTENVYYMIVSDEKEFMKDYLEKYQLEAEDKPVKWRESFNLRGSEDQKLKAVKELKAQAESEFEHTGVQGRYLEKETFFGYCKDDGFKKKKNLGRVEQFNVDNESLWKKLKRMALPFQKSQGRTW